MFRASLLLSLVGLLSGCVLSPGAVSSSGSKALVLSRMTLDDDPRTGWITTYGPAVEYLDGNFQKRSYRVRSRLDDGAASRGKTFQIYVQGMFPKRVFLKQAYADGKPLDTTVIDRERRSDGTLETIGINVTDEEMSALAVTGIKFRIIGRRAEVAMDIPAAYFQAALEFHTRAKAKV